MKSTKFQNKVIKETLKDLKEKFGWTQSSIERALDLKQGCLNTENSPEAIALMKIIRVFPWVVKVADRDYNERYIKKEMLHAFVDVATKEELHEFIEKFGEA